MPQDKALELLLQNLHRIVPFDTASVQRLSAGELKVVACQGFKEPGKVIGLVFPLNAKFPNYNVLTTKAPVAIENVPAVYPHFHDEARVYVSDAIRAWMGFPLLLQDKTLGMITLDRHDTQSYTAHDAEIVAAFASQATVAIESAQRYQELRAYSSSLEQRIEERTLELQDALAIERELKELKALAIATISHEFRTPLSVILSTFHILKEYHDRLTSEQIDSQFKKTTLAIRHMTNLIDNISLIGQGEAGELPFNPSPVNLITFCRELAEETLEYAEKQQQLDFSAKGIKHEVSVDVDLIRRALGNVLSNAANYAPEGSRIHFAVQGRKAHVLFLIRDEGIGIPAEERDYIFDPFYRASNVGSVGGAGLGLQIARQAVERHGGTIAIESNPVAGTTVTIQIPLT
ncbi:MAG TPA: ATP-binding protein [Aggregatilineales bacterium]|nr:ATP-binding protein [Aggregatilineales bacterium]